MIYLESYKLFESKSDIINQLEDILMEISDEGIDVNIGERWSKLSQDNLLEITLGDYKKSFSLDRFIEVLEHLNSFLEDNGYVYSQAYWEKFSNLMNDLKKGRKLLVITLPYKLKSNK
jgi:hypothetical protein